MKNSRSLLTLGLACATVTFSLAVCAQAQTLTYFAIFNGTDGDGPSSIIQATDGNFYGTTSMGGSSQVGSVFKVTQAGAITSIYSFCSQPKCADGTYPETPPILGSDGNLYGVTYQGGTKFEGGSGVIYKLTLDGQITILHTFCHASCTDGAYPNGIILASDGNFYGTTNQGGGPGGYGTLFKISPAGEFTVLHTFCSEGCAGGSEPRYPPIQAANGSFYGTACCGGGPPELAAGVLYELTAAGEYQVIHQFSCNDYYCPGGYVPATAVQDDKGDLFGISGYADRFGTVLEITSEHQFTVLHDFTANGADAYPDAGLTLANDGNLYGTTLGIDGHGTMYEMSLEGTYTTLENGEYGTPFQEPDGNLYGSGGSGPYGALYKLSNGLKPLVKTVPVAGPVGQSVIILGNNLTGSTSVTFNGVAAAFTVESDTYIRATVPAGATTGTVSAVTPNGALNSNPQFVVTK